MIFDFSEIVCLTNPNPNPSGSLNISVRCCLSFPQVLQHAQELNVSKRREWKVPMVFQYKNADKVLEDFANYNYRVCNFIWSKCRNLTEISFGCADHQILYVYVSDLHYIYLKLNEYLYMVSRVTRTGSRRNNH